MTTFTNSFENTDQADGSTLTTGNSGYPGGTALDRVAGDATYDTDPAHTIGDTRDAQLVAEATISTTDKYGYVGWDLTGGWATVYWRTFCFVPTSSLTWKVAIGRDNNAIDLWSVVITGNSYIQLRDATNTPVATGTTKLLRDSLIRVEGKVVIDGSLQANNVMEVKIFNTLPLNSTTPDETLTFNGPNLGSQGGKTYKIDLGVVSPSAKAQTLYIDDIGVSDTGYLGPISSSSGTTTLSGLWGGGFINVIAAASSSTLIAGEDVGGLWQSTDGTVTWTPHNHGLYPQQQIQIASVYVDPDDPTVIYAAAGAQSPASFLMSTDSGATWTMQAVNPAVRFHAGNNKSVPALPPTHPRSVGSLIGKLTISATNYLFAASYDSYANTTPYGVMRSTDSGATWISIGLNTVGVKQYLRSLVVDTVNNYVFVAVYGEGVYVCQNPSAGSPTFTLLNGTNAPTHPEELMVLGGNLYAACDHEGVRRVTTIGVGAGTAWTDITGTLARGTSETGSSGLPIGTGPPDDSTALGPFWCSIAGRIDGSNHVIYVGASKPDNTNGSKTAYRAIWVNQAAEGGSNHWHCVSDNPSNIAFTVGGPAGVTWWFELSNQTGNMVNGASFVASSLVLVGNILWVSGRSAVWRYKESPGGGEVNWYPMVNGLGGTINREIMADPNYDQTWVGNTDWVVIKSPDDMATVLQDSPSPNTGYSMDVNENTTPGRVYVGVGDRDNNALGAVWSKLPTDTTWQNEALFTSSQSASDSFTRTVAPGGWGNAEVGGAWSTPNIPSSFSVNGSQGLIEPPVSQGTTAIATLNSINWEEPAISVTVSWDTAPSASASATHSVGVAGRVNTNTFFAAYIKQTGASGNPTTLRAVASESGSEVSSSEINIDPPALNQNYILGLNLQQVAGDNTQVIVTFYPQDSPDQIDTITWNYINAGSPLQSSSGHVQIRLIRSAPNSADTTFSFDDFDATGGSSSSTGQRPLGLAVGKDASSLTVILAAVEQLGIRRKVGSGSFQTVTVSGSPKPMDPATTQATKSAPMSWPGSIGPYVYLFDRQTGIWRSADYGASWILIFPTAQMSGYAATDRNGYVMADPTTPGRIYVTWNNGILRLDNAHTGTPLPGGTISRTDLSGVAQPGAITVDPSGAVVVVSQASQSDDPALYRSTDNGANWTDKADDLYRDVAGFPQNVTVARSGRIFVSLQGSGVVVIS